MYPPSTREFRQFLISGYETGRFLVARENGQVRAVLVFDQLSDGLSSVYCFFDPEYSHFSPGIFLITNLTRLTQMLGLHYHYLGYWVNGCDKMSYKQDFSPLQYFIDRKWQELSQNEL
jgi:arginine-tRNA-protein transferase